jgi:hypothetical protein
MGNMAAVCLQAQPKSEADIPCASPLLYNLTKDPSQTTNVASNHPTIIADMRKIMKAQHETGHYCGGA